jgi:cytochrome P450
METELDPIDAVTAADPTRQYAAIADEPELRWHQGRGLWVAAHPDVVREVLSCPECRVRPLGAPVPAHLAGTQAGTAFGRFARMRDGDDHLPSRRAIVRALSELDLNDVRSATERLAAGMPVDDLDRICFELPVRAMGAVLGVPDAALADLARWTKALVRCVHATATRSETEAGVDAAAGLDGVFRHLLRSPEPPVVLATMDEAFRMEGLTIDCAVANHIGLLFQTHDATAGLIGNAVAYLSRRPGAAGGPIDAVIERVAQRDPPVHNTRRFVAREVVIAGQRVAAGDTILVVLAAAGVAEPDRLWTFGYGAHACPGQAVALTIASAAIETLLRRGDLPVELPDRMRYCPLGNVRIPVFSPVSEEASS